MQNNLSKSSDEEIQGAVSSALEAGYRHIDAAYLYQNEGAIGKVLQEWIQSGRVKREELFITTKVIVFLFSVFNWGRLLNTRNFFCFPTSPAALHRKPAWESVPFPWIVPSKLASRLCGPLLNPLSRRIRLGQRHGPFSKGWKERVTYRLQDRSSLTMEGIKETH